MQGQVLVDTDVIIDFLNGIEPQAGAVEKLLREYRLFLSSITVFELFAGVTGGRRISAIEKLVQSTHVFEIGEKEARTAASIYTGLKRRGRLIGNSDLLIAATALSKNMHLYTRNLDHFSRIEGLTVWEPD